jgi:hypothetical protein
MPLAVQPPVVVAERPDAWLAAPAVTSKATAWLAIPAGLGFPDVVTRRSGDSLVVRSAGKQRVVFAGGCQGGEACDAVRAPAAIGPAEFGYAVTAGAAATYVAAVDANGRTTVLRANERPADAARMMVAATPARLVWVEAGAIVARDAASGAIRRVAAPRGVAGDVTSLAAAGDRVLWSVRDGDTTKVRLKVGGAAVTELFTEKGGRAVGGVALATDGTALVARRVIDRRRARVEIVIVPPGGPARVIARSARYGGGARAELPRLAAAGTLVAYRLRSGRRGTSESIWVADLGGRGARRLVTVARGRARLSDPGVAPGRVVWARSELGADGRRLAGSRVVSVGVRVR